MAGETVQVRTGDTDAVMFRRRDLTREILADYFDLNAGSLTLETDEEGAIWLDCSDEGVYDLEDLPANDLKLLLSGRAMAEDEADGVGVDQNGVPVVQAVQTVQIVVQAAPEGIYSDSFKIQMFESRMDGVTLKVEKGIKMHSITVETAKGVNRDIVAEAASAKLNWECVLCVDDKGMGRAVPDCEATRTQFWWAPTNTVRKFLAVPKAEIVLRDRAFKTLTVEQRQQCIDEDRPVADMLLEWDVKAAKEHLFGLCEELITCSLCMRPYHNSSPLQCQTCHSLVGCTDCVDTSLHHQMESEFAPKCPKCNTEVDVDGVGDARHFTPVWSFKEAIDLYAQVQDQRGDPQ